MSENLESQNQNMLQTCTNYLLHSVQKCINKVRHDVCFRNPDLVDMLCSDICTFFITKTTSISQQSNHQQVQPRTWPVEHLSLSWCKEMMSCALFSKSACRIIPMCPGFCCNLIVPMLRDLQFNRLRTYTCSQPYSNAKSLVSDSCFCGIHHAWLPVCVWRIKYHRVIRWQSLTHTYFVLLLS